MPQNSLPPGGEDISAQNAEQDAIINNMLKGLESDVTAALSGG